MSELFTLEDLAAFRRSDESYDPADDVAARDAATGLVRGYCGWHVAPTQADTYDYKITDAGEDGWTFFLPTLYLTQAPIVTLPDLSLTTAFSWSPGGRISRTYTWGTVDQLVSVAFQHGFPDGSVQHKLAKGVALGVAKRLIETNELQAGGSLLPAEESQLHPLRIIAIA